MSTHTVRLNSGAHFPCAPGESMLEAAMRSQVTLPYSCRTGRCSTCKCKVRHGASRALRDELGLTELERAQGWILSCVRTAESNLDLDVEDMAEFSPPAVKTLPCRIDQLQKLAGDVLGVVLRLAPNATFDFLPGQYIEVIGPQGLRRSYSLANATAASRQLQLHVRAVPGGEMSRYWFEQAKANDLLRLNGPLGSFFLRKIAGLDLVFLATGTGIAPVKAMLEGLSEMSSSQQPRSVTVYWGSRIPGDLYVDVASLSAGLRYVPVLSRADAQWSGARGYVQGALLAAEPKLQETVVYACGSDAMIRSARDLLMAAGLPEQRFHSDAFICSAVH